MDGTFIKSSELGNLSLLSAVLPLPRVYLTENVNRVGSLSAAAVRTARKTVVFSKGFGPEAAP